MEVFKVVQEGAAVYGKTMWVAPDISKYVSCFSPRILAYEVGVPTVPNPYDGPLAAFDSFEKAYNWCRQRGFTGSHATLRIFRAEAEQHTGKKQLWFGRRSPHYPCGANPKTGEINLPEGTVFCSSITIREEVPVMENLHIDLADDLEGPSLKRRVEEVISERFKA